MGKMTSVALDDHMADFVAGQVDAGEFGSEAEVIRAGLRLLEERAVKLAELRALIAEGEASGYVEFEPETWLAEWNAEWALKDESQIAVPSRSKRSSDTL